ncbi:MAG: bifunctional phosphopantothenoylcysteine decarboxylase/phosphopantothenate--cysteine ligase CoaBC [Christensenellales bacterium]|jgi:phosphopantothenoylcysteine decarboxylase/phosphopantothenate--cysteine ligase
MAALCGKTILVGVTGGIAAYKACELVSRLKKLGAQVHVVMTASACRLVQPAILRTLSQNHVATDVFEELDAGEVTHIALAKAADLAVIAPASANVIAKLAHGIADDMLTTTLLAIRAPLLIAPAMNTAMYQHPATQANLQTLIDRGATAIGPEGGLLACGDEGPGRMSEPLDIANKCLEMLCRRQDLAGLKVLVTAGPTREALDPVRYLTNHSSGKMGYAIAEAALARGAEVTLVTGPVALPAVAGAVMVPVTTTEDLYEAMMKLAPTQDAVIQAAAPADYRAAAVAPQKLKKQGEAGLTLSLVPTRDVARAIGEGKKAGQVFVGFAAETENLLENARKKLVSKRLDLIVINDVTQPGAGFGVDTNIATILGPQSHTQLPKMKKRELADRILDEVKALVSRPE